MSNINDNDIEKNNNLTKNNKNSPENSYIDPLEKNLIYLVQLKYKIYQKSMIIIKIKDLIIKNIFVLELHLILKRKILKTKKMIYMIFFLKSSLLSMNI